VTDDEFERTAQATINRALASALDPVPHVAKPALEIDKNIWAS
jgi:hypothetical protein